MIVADAILPAVIDRLLARISEIVVGPPELGKTTRGPITTARQFACVRDTLEAAARWTKPIAGGNLAESDGFFIEPTIFLDVPQDHDLWRKEIFGPVLALKGFADEDDAVHLANDTDYGLVATLVSPDRARTNRVAAAMQAGTVWINAPQVIFPQTGWGGFKASGIGRELGPWGLASFSAVKHIVEAV